jgi:hypothetical protein
MIHIGIIGPDFGGDNLFARHYKPAIDKYAALPPVTFHVFGRRGIGRRAIEYIDRTLVAENAMYIYTVRHDDPVVNKDGPHVYLQYATADMAYTAWLAAASSNVVQFWPVLSPFTDAFDFARPSAKRSRALPYVSSFAAEQTLLAMSHTSVPLPDETIERIRSIVDDAFAVAPASTTIDDYAGDRADEAAADEHTPQIDAEAPFDRHAQVGGAAAAIQRSRRDFVGRRGRLDRRGAVGSARRPAREAEHRSRRQRVGAQRGHRRGDERTARRVCRRRRRGRGR